MTIATNNGVPIIRDGKVVTDCGCCGPVFQCTPSYCLSASVTISGGADAHDLFAYGPSGGDYPYIDPNQEPLPGFGVLPKEWYRKTFHPLQGEQLDIISTPPGTWSQTAAGFVVARLWTGEHSPITPITTVGAFSASILVSLSTSSVELISAYWSDYLEERFISTSTWDSFRKCGFPYGFITSIPQSFDDVSERVLPFYYAPNVFNRPRASILETGVASIVFPPTSRNSESLRFAGEGGDCPSTQFPTLPMITLTIQITRSDGLY